MMYLGIFVFAVLTASSLGQGLYEDEGFKCPFCTARGDNAKANCDKNIVPADCGNRQNPICTITKYSHGRVVRLCSDIDAYETSLFNCEKYKNCEKAMCEESGCMAEFTAAEQDEPTGQFMCPVCSAGGENADSECEAKIVNKPCLVADPVCSLTVSTASSFMKFRIRDCRSREYYTQTKDDCEQRGNCAMAMCDTSACKAEFPAPA